MKTFSITLIIAAILFSNFTAKAEMELIPVSTGEDANIKQWVSNEFEMESPQLVNAFTIPLSIDGLFDYTFNWEGDNIGYASCWIFTYRDSLDYNKIASITAVGNGFILKTEVSLALFDGCKFSASEKINISDQDFAEYITKIKNQSSIYEKITNMNIDYEDDFFFTGVGFPDSIDFGSIDLTNLDKEKLIYYACAFGYNTKEVFCYADAMPVGELSCAGDNGAISEPALFLTNNLCSPNPASNDCALNFDLTESASLSISIIDMLGRNIMDVYDGYANIGKFSQYLDIKNLPNGVYTIIIRRGDKIVKVEKLIVNK